MDINDFYDAKEANQAHWEVGQADMIIIALAPQAGLRSDFKSWMESWPRFPIQPKRLLVGFWDFTDQGTEAAVVQEEFLQQLSEAKRMDYISNLTSSSLLKGETARRLPQPKPAWFTSRHVKPV